jgi:glycosyltransferase involved in cell wall biosynthesis
VDLLVLGQGDPNRQEYVAELRERAAAVPGLKLRMYGPYQRGELPHLLRDVDCVVVPSLVPESGGLVPREALAQGVPIVVARRGALPEVVAEGDNGFTFDPTRPGELAAVLRRLLREEGLLARLRAGARKTPVVTVADHAQAVRSVYEEAAGEMLRSGPVGCTEVEELGFLHEALVDLRFGGVP